MYKNKCALYSVHTLTQSLQNTYDFFQEDFYKESYLISP
jgi:hypothetical protein